MMEVTNMAIRKLSIPVRTMKIRVSTSARFWFRSPVKSSLRIMEEVSKVVSAEDITADNRAARNSHGGSHSKGACSPSPVYGIAGKVRMGK